MLLSIGKILANPSLRKVVSVCLSINRMSIIVLKSIHNPMALEVMNFSSLFSDSFRVDIKRREKMGCVWLVLAPLSGEVSGHLTLFVRLSGSF